MLEAAAEAIQAPDHERVAGAHVVEAGVQFGAVFERAGADVLVNARAACLV